MMLLISSSVTPCGVPSKRCFRKINSKVAAATNAKSSFIHRRRGTRDALRTNALFSPDTDDCKREECSVPNPPASCLDPGLNSDLLSSADCALSVAKKFSRNEQWIEYQNPNRYWEQMASIGGSVVARRVTLPAVILATWALGVNEVRDFEALEQLSNATPFVQVIGGAMTLLLAFRTNAAYARFGAACDSFAEVLASTRNLSRKIVVWCPMEHRGEMAQLVSAIPWAVKHRGQGIEGTQDAFDELSLYLDDECFKAIDLAKGNVPAQLMTVITRRLDQMNEHKVELIYQLLMDNDLTALHSNAARTDRLATQPTPVSYSRHISRGLIVWLLALPATVASTCPWWVIGPGTLVVSWLLLGIDDIGMQLEQPYTVMPVKKFCEECSYECASEILDSQWTPRLGANKRDVLRSDFLNSELTQGDRVVVPVKPVLKKSQTQLSKSERRTLRKVTEIPLLR